EYVWATSWGVSTRLIGGLVMAHSDDQGLVMPPRIAPLQVVIVPIYKGDDGKKEMAPVADKLISELKAAGVRVKYDDSDNQRPGWKFAEYELKGVPVRITLGARDLANGVVELARRDTKEKTTVPLEGLTERIQGLLVEIQDNLFARAKAFRDAHITKVDSWEEFERTLDEKTGFVSAHWDGTSETETAIKEKTKATIRCIPLDNEQEEGKCVLTGKPSIQRVLFARAY
ncbi:MAG: proline--tRNA ligase, partial [Verrucomicrobiaceae bacterium]